MVDQLQMRTSDRDRQQAVDRLRGALEDGRLTMAEYVDRMGVAYQAATYGDLAPLCADLNVVVWIMVSDPSGHLSYPWPLWVAGPYGAVLVAVSASVTLFRRSRPPARSR